MRISDNVRASTGPDGAVLMDIDGGQLYNLNPAGSIVWQQISKGHTPEEIASFLASHFGVPESQTLQDVNDLLQTLEQQKLIFRPEFDSGE